MNGIEVRMNKEIMEYKEAIFLGLSLRQLLFSILAAGMAVLLFFCFRDLLGTEGVSWLCIAGAAPFALLGFFRFNGMNFEQFLAAYIRCEFMVPTKLVYRSENLYARLLGRDKCD